MPPCIEKLIKKTYSGRLLGERNDITNTLLNKYDKQNDLKEKDKKEKKDDNDDKVDDEKSITSTKTQIFLDSFDNLLHDFQYFREYMIFKHGISHDEKTKFIWNPAPTLRFLWPRDKQDKFDEILNSEEIPDDKPKDKNDAHDIITTSKKKKKRDIDELLKLDEFKKITTSRSLSHVLMRVISEEKVFEFHMGAKTEKNLLQYIATRENIHGYFQNFYYILIIFKKKMKFNLNKLKEVEIIGSRLDVESSFEYIKKHGELYLSYPILPSLDTTYLAKLNGNLTIEFLFDDKTKNEKENNKIIKFPEITTNKNIRSQSRFNISILPELNKKKIENKINKDDIIPLATNTINNDITDFTIKEKVKGLVQTMLNGINKYNNIEEINDDEQKDIIISDEGDGSKLNQCNTIKTEENKEKKKIFKFNEEKSQKFNGSIYVNDDGDNKNNLPNDNDDDDDSLDVFGGDEYYEKLKLKEKIKEKNKKNEKLNVEGEYCDNFNVIIDNVAKNDDSDIDDKDDKVDDNIDLKEEFPLKVNLSDINTSANSGGNNSKRTSFGFGNKCPRFLGYYDHSIYYPKKPKFKRDGTPAEPFLRYENIDVYYNKVSPPSPSIDANDDKDDKDDDDQIMENEEKSAKPTGIDMAKMGKDGMVKKKIVKFVSLGKKHYYSK